MTTFYNLPAMGETVHLHTHLVVREDAHILFGFSTEPDRVMFRALIRVNGVGPKLALTILSGQILTHDQMRMQVYRFAHSR
jgi:Holliday junction DNA helicase RuvA